MMKITDKSILEVYKEEGKIREYGNCLKYIALMNKHKNKSDIKNLAKRLKINIVTARHWIKRERTPYGIKCLKFLKIRKLLPYHSNEKTARIVGLLHGDGCLMRNLLSFSFISKDKNMILEIKKDVEEEFKIPGKVKKKRDKGDVEYIYGKKVLVKCPTYELKFHNKPISALLFKLGVPRGKKMYQKTFVPDWIMKGNKSIQKAFLYGLFDSELANARISTFKNHKDNLASPRMELCKTKEFENNLSFYLAQVKKLLKNFSINSKVAYLQEYDEAKKVGLTLSIHNKLSNIYYFVENIGFYYNKERIKASIRVRKLAIEKIKKKNALYKVFDYCKEKDSFTMQDLEKELAIAPSHTKVIGLYIYKNGFAQRLRSKDRWFEYYPQANKIQKIINNPLLLEELPRLTR